MESLGGSRAVSQNLHRPGVGWGGGRPYSQATPMRYNDVAGQPVFIHKFLSDSRFSHVCIGNVAMSSFHEENGAAEMARRHVEARR